MEKKELLFLEFDLDLMKGRKGLPIGTEKMFSGTMYVKTASGWKPKTDPREKKMEAPSTPRMKKPEEQKEGRIKQIEEFAKKAKDSQLEAAIKDPKQEQEIKDIAQAELDKRNGKKETEELSNKDVLDKFQKLKKELEETLKQAKEIKEKEKEESKDKFQVIKKTGIVLDGHKVFIVMNTEGNGYKTQGMKSLKLESKKGESLSDFKQRIKDTWKENSKVEKVEPKVEKVEPKVEKVEPKVEKVAKKLKKKFPSLDLEVQKKIENLPFFSRLSSSEDELKSFCEGYLGDITEKKKYFSVYRNTVSPSVVQSKKQLVKDLDSLVTDLPGKNEKYYQKAFSSLQQKYNELGASIFKNPGNIMEEVTKNYIDMEGSEDEDLYHYHDEVESLMAARASVQKFLITNNYEPICLPEYYSNYKGQEYECYALQGIINEDHAGSGAEKYEKEELSTNATKFEKEAISAYVGNSFYKFMTEYMYKNGDLSKISQDAKKRAEKAYGSVEAASEITPRYCEAINEYIDKNRIKDNIVLSRRVDPFRNETIFSDMSNLSKGDTGEFKSIQSFSMVEASHFGDFQITLLAKKGDSIANGLNQGELEYLLKQNSKFKVLETGFNSIVIELESSNGEK